MIHTVVDKVMRQLGSNDDTNNTFFNIVFFTIHHIINKVIDLWLLVISATLLLIKLFYR